MGIKGELLNTGEEYDEVLNVYGDKEHWIELRKGFEDKVVKGITEGRIYQIKKIFSKPQKSQLWAIIINNFGKERNINLKYFKYITCKQREAIVKEREWEALKKALGERPSYVIDFQI